MAKGYNITNLTFGYIVVQNWLPRRVMSAWRIAGILHGIEGWNVNECGNEMFNIDEIWQASLRHGFTPLTTSIN